MKVGVWKPSFFAMFLTCGLMAHPLDSWYLRSSALQPTGLNAVVYGEGQFVAVGDAGFVMASTNGINWEFLRPLGTNHLRSVTYADGRFVAVGNAGTIFWSDDGRAWNDASLTMNHDITAVGHGVFVGDLGSKFIGLATYTRALLVEDRTISVTSSNGIHWQTNSLGAVGFASGPFSSMAFAAGRMVAAKGTQQESGFSPYVIHTTNGTHWKSAAFAPLGNVGSDGHRFILVNLINLQTVPESVIWRSSLDGFEWGYTNSSSSGSGYEPRGLCFGGGQFVAVGPTRSATSLDGTNWTVSTLSNGAPALLRSVAFGQETYVAVGSPREIHTSPDGLSWTLRSITPRQHFRAISSGDSICIAAGLEGKISWSSTGRNWEAAASPTSNHLRAIFSSQHRHVAAGDRGTIVSTDGTLNFSTRRSGTEKILYGISASESTFVVIGDAGTIVTSEDTIDWTLRQSSLTNALFGIAYGNGTFAAVGTAGSVITSPDGRQWERQISGASRALYDVAFGRGRFVAVGDSLGIGPSVFTSTNGVYWTSAATSRKPLGRITFGGGMFVYPSPDNSNVRFCFSTDGQTWTVQAPVFLSFGSTPLNDIGYHQGTFISVGDNWQIWQSAPFFQVVLDHTSGLGQIESQQDGAYQVEVSSNIGEASNWTVLTNLVAFPYRFSDPESDAHPARFYRARWSD